MKKQIDGQINLFEYISEEEENSNVEIVQDQDILISYYKECSSCWCSITGRERLFPVTLPGKRSLVLPVITVSARRKRKYVRLVLMKMAVSFGRRKRVLFSNNGIFRNKMKQ